MIERYNSQDSAVSHRRAIGLGACGGTPSTVAIWWGGLAIA
jgi:hypothetical protein